MSEEPRSIPWAAGAEPRRGLDAPPNAPGRAIGVTVRERCWAAALGAGFGHARAGRPVAGPRPSADGDRPG